MTYYVYRYLYMRQGRPAPPHTPSMVWCPGLAAPPPPPPSIPPLCGSVGVVGGEGWNPTENQKQLRAQNH